MRKITIFYTIVQHHKTIDNSPYRSVVLDDFAFDSHRIGFRLF